MSQEINKKQTLFEDLQIGSNNFMGTGKGPGQSAMSLKPAKVTLMDLIKQANDWESEMGKAPNRLPFPLQDGLSDRLGDLFVKTQEIKSEVAESTKYSIIKDNKKAYEAIKRIHKKLTTIGAAIQDVVEDIDNIGVGSSSPEYHA
jgi:hypothetical protein